jgi:hypothetical protein
MMTNDAEDLLYAYLLSFAHFKIELCMFLVLSIKSSLYILDSGPLSDMCLTIISLVCGLSFYTLSGIFCRAEVLNFSGVTEQFSWWCNLTSHFGVSSNNSSANPDMHRFLLCFLLEVLWH